MKYSKKRFLVGAIISFCVVFSAVFLSGNVFAGDYDWSSGGQGGGGGDGSVTGDTYFDCTSRYTTAHVDDDTRCPRWILVPNAVYKQIIREGRVIGEYKKSDGTSGLPSCDSDNYIMIAGNQRYDGSLQIYNINSAYRPNPLKETHSHTSVASSINEVTQYFWKNDSENFFSWPNGNNIKDNIGRVLTYKEVLNNAITLSGISEVDLAVVCPSMVAIEYTLTGYPVDISGNSITTNGGNWSSKAVSGGSASVSAGKNDGYTFLGWRTSPTSGNPSGGATYTVNPLTSNIDVYAVYGKKPTLTGTSISIVDNSSLSSVTNLGDKTDKVEYNTKAEVTRGTNDDYVFKGWRTSPTSGNPSGGATYSVDNLKENKKVYAVYAPYRTLSGMAVVDDAVCTRMTDYDPAQSKVEWNTEAKITKKDIPNLTFKGWSKVGCGGSIISNKSSYTETIEENTPVYAVYEPIALPCSLNKFDISSDCGSTVRVEQSKDGTNWTTSDLYMKPNEVVHIRGYFNPQYQDQKDTKPQKLAIAGSSYENNSSNTIEGYFNSKVNSSWKWKNAFSIRYDGQSGSWGCNKLKKGTSGSNGEYSDVYNYVAKLGKKGEAKAATNECDDAKSTPKGIHFSYDGAYNLQASIDNGSNETGTVKAYTPYNFENKIKIDTEGGIVYAGEVKTVASLVAVNKKTNRLTTDGSKSQAYATNVKGAKIKLELTYSNGDTATIYSDLGDIDGDSSNPKNITFGIKDLPAGTTVTVKASVYPATSGDDDNWHDEEGDHNWAYSNEVVFTIARKPSFQVLGGSVYSNGVIIAPAALKNNIRGVSGYEYSETEITSNRKAVAFGSWVEQAVVSNGTVMGLASGAATGLNIVLNDNLVNGIKETVGSQYCTNRVSLSFANYFNTDQGCPHLEELTGMLGAANNTIDRASLISYILGGNNVENIKLTADNNYTISETNISAGITKVVTTDNAEGADTITIAGNLTYSDEVYNSLDAIPKFIVYADNINIACNVERVDAILIANNKIDTCPNSDGEKINENKNRNQLTINGLIITNSLDLNRTAGATAGIGSGTPAEIVNYDTSTILWSMSQAATDDYAGMTSVYQHELAPRQ